MAGFEGSYKSLLQGVSQQVPRERLPGQVSAQNNMLSDAVSNLRRRPGAEIVRSISTPTAVSGKVVGWDTDIGGVKLKVLLNIVDGTLTMLNGNYANVQTLTNSYLIASERTRIQATTVGERMVLVNLGVKPTAGAALASGLAPTLRGWFYIKAGSFSKAYTVSVVLNGTTTTRTYTTPNGSTAGDSALSTPEYIAGQLNSLLNTAGMSSTVSGAFVHVAPSGATSVTLSTDSYSAFIVTSGNAYLQTIADLPQRLPAAGDGYIIATTSARSPVYYRYSLAQSAWLESGSFGAPGSLTNMPVVVQRNAAGTAWEFDTTPYEGMFSGDANSNPGPTFLSRGITGSGSFQGRLVLLAGPTANLSGSGKIQRWFRSTITDIIDSDPISVGATANSSAAYVWAVPFQKDLILFSEKYQALIPSGNTALTPRNATVVITSSFESDIGAQPIGMGRTLAYPVPRSAGFFGVLEMTPSQYTDSQYTSNDVTAHIPKYLPGRCAWSVASSVANIVIFGSTGDPFSCTVHEYLWSGTDKVQQAWHKWTFPYPISDAFFSGASITFVFVQNGVTVLATLDPRAGALTSGLDTRPFLDLSYMGSVVNNVFTLDATMRQFDPSLAGKTKLSNRNGALAGEWVGANYTAATDAVLTMEGDSFPNGPVFAGVPYRSTVSPTTPDVKDSNGVIISSNKLTILRYMVGTTMSGEYNVLVTDAATEEQNGGEIAPTLYWDSPELMLERSRLSLNSVALVPCRTNAATTSLLISTEGLQELNVISLEYVCKYNQKIRRR